MIITSAIDNAARIAKAESLKSACEKTSILSVLFPSEGLESTELSKRKERCIDIFCIDGIYVIMKIFVRI